MIRVEDIVKIRNLYVHNMQFGKPTFHHIYIISDFLLAGIG